MTREVAREVAELLESAEDVGDERMADVCRRALGGDETAQAVAISFYDEIAAQTDEP